MIPRYDPVSSSIRGRYLVFQSKNRNFLFQTADVLKNKDSTFILQAKLQFEVIKKKDDAEEPPQCTPEEAIYDCGCEPMPEGACNCKGDTLDLIAVVE